MSNIYSHLILDRRMDGRQLVLITRGNRRLVLLFSFQMSLDFGMSFSQVRQELMSQLEQLRIKLAGIFLEA